MKRLCLLLVSIVNVSVGMDLELRINQGIQGTMKICECKTLQNEELFLNESKSLQGVVFCNLERSITMKPNSSLNRFGTITIYSEKPVIIENLDADSCVIFSPDAILSGRCKIDNLTATKNVSILEGSALTSKQIDFTENNADVHFFNIFGELKGDNLQINGNKLTIKNNGTVSLDNLELSDFGKESSIDFLQYGSLSANGIKQQGHSFLNKGQTNIRNYNSITPTKFCIEDGDFRVGLLTGNVGSMEIFSSAKAHLDRIEGHLGYFRNRSSLVCEIGELDLDQEIQLPH